MFLRLFAVLLALTALQDTGLLRVRLTLTDANGVDMPLPRILLLVSDDPATAEPRRIRTNADGIAEVKLRPGTYTVELDEPVSFRGQAYTWTQTIEVAAGRDTVVDLNGSNGEAVASARLSADSATVLAAWRDSVVEIWTPTTHASGFVIDSSGLIATTDRALGGQTWVEVELTTGKARSKVDGRVILSQYDPGVAFIWVNPQAIAATPPVKGACADTPATPVSYKDVVTSIGVSVLTQKELADGRVTKVTPQAIFSDMRIGDDSAGGPVFAENGTLIGLTSIDDPADLRRWNDAWIVPIEKVCAVKAAAIAKMTGPAPSAAQRPVDPPRAAVAAATIQKPAAQKQQAPIVKASDFDVTLFTPQLAHELEISGGTMRTDFGAWSQYVRDAPPVLLIRVSPQFEEAMWKTIARGYAALNGIWLNRFNSFTANFLRLQAFCGDREVLPIHPFVIEHKIPEHSPIREGLYVFDRSELGPQCTSVRLDMYSEKQPNEPDKRTIDPKLFEQLK